MAEAFHWRGRAVRGILLDMDGTLCDTKEAHADAWKHWACLHNIPVSREQYLAEYFGRSNKEVMPELFPHISDPALLRELAMEREHLFLDEVRAGKIHPTAGLADFVRRAHARGIGLAIASSAPRENVELISHLFGLQDKIPVRLSMDDVRRAKPAPDLFLAAADHLGLDPEECVVVEDSRFGLEAGRSAASRTIALTTLHPAEELRDLADLCVRDFEELLALDEWRSL